MTLGIVVLVLASALVHASWNALLKRHPDTEGAAVAFLLVTAVAGGVATLVDPRPSFPTAAALAWTLLSGVFEGVYFVTLALALARAPMGLAYTISRGGALLVVWPVSLAFMGEAVSVLGATGAVLIALGLALTGLEPRRDARAGAGVRWAALCALAIAAYHLAYKQALAAGGAPSAVFTLSIVLALPLNLGRFGRDALARPLRAWRARPLMVTAAGTLATASFLAFLEALARGGAGTVLTLRNTSIVFAQALALMIGERPGRPQLVGAAVVTAGAVLLGWPS